MNTIRIFVRSFAVLYLSLSLIYDTQAGLYSAVVTAFLIE